MRSILDPVSEKVERGIDLKRLRYFIAVCDYGGISKAATAIGIAQPALTRQIKLLEAQIGRPLINRSGRGVEPSRPGRYILDRSREHINSLDNLLSSVRAAFPVTQEPFVLGICPEIASLVLDDFGDQIRSELSHIALSVVRGTSTDMQSLIECGRLDMALTYRSAERVEGVFTDLLAERFQLVRLSERPGTARRWSLADIAKMKLVLPSRMNEARAVIDRIFEENEVHLHPHVELDSIDAVILMLSQRESNYASILPTFSVDRWSQERSLRRDEIDEPAMQRTIAIAGPAVPRNSAASELIAAQVREAVARLDH